MYSQQAQRLKCVSVTPPCHQWPGSETDRDTHSTHMGTDCTSLLLSPCSREGYRSFSGNRHSSPQSKRFSGVDPSRVMSVLDTGSAAPQNSPPRNPERVVPSSESIIWVSIHPCSRAGHYVGHPPAIASLCSSVSAQMNPTEPKYPLSPPYLHPLYSP